MIIWLCDNICYKAAICSNHARGTKKYTHLYLHTNKQTKRCALTLLWLQCLYTLTAIRLVIVCNYARLRFILCPLWILTIQSRYYRTADRIFIFVKHETLEQRHFECKKSIWLELPWYYIKSQFSFLWEKIFQKKLFLSNSFAATKKDRSLWAHLKKICNELVLELKPHSVFK